MSFWRGNVDDVAIGLSSVRGENATGKENMETTLSTISKEVKNLTEQQRVGASKMQNLEDQLKLLNKAIQEKKHEVEPKKEQSMATGQVEVEKERDARNLGAVWKGPGNKENCRPRNRSQVAGHPKIPKITV